MKHCNLLQNELSTLITHKLKSAPAGFYSRALLFLLSFRLSVPLVLLLFFHSELILGRGSPMCKFEPDLFIPSEARIASHRLFCSHCFVPSLSRLNYGQAENTLCDSTRPCAAFISHPLCSVFSILHLGPFLLRPGLLAAA